MIVRTAIELVALLRDVRKEANMFANELSRGRVYTMDQVRDRVVLIRDMIPGDEEDVEPHSDRPTPPDR